MRQTFVAGITYCALYLCGFERSWTEVKYRHLLENLIPEEVRGNRISWKEPKEPKLLHGELLRQLKEAEADEADVDARCRTVLTLCSVFLALTGIVSPDSPQSAGIVSVILIVIAAAFFTLTILMLLVYFDAGWGMHVVIDERQVKQDESELYEQLLTDIADCLAFRLSRIGYKLDVYRTSRSFFLIALVVLVVLAGNVFFSDQQDPLEEIGARLKSSDELMKLIQGPQGPPGAVDIDAIVVEVLRDPRFGSGHDAPEPTDNENAK